MKSIIVSLALTTAVLRAAAHHPHVDEHSTLHPDQQLFNSKPPAPGSETWLEKYGPQADLVYTGPLSFSHLEYARCLEDEAAAFDIAVLGMPFDTAVTYRPGTRFGPTGIRVGSRRQHGARAYTLSWGMNPYEQGTKIIDCGDVPVNPFDNALALEQMEVAYSTLLRRDVARNGSEALTGDMRAFAFDKKEHPKIVTLGGDHTIVLPILRALHKVYGPISVIHFDAHLDTWSPGAISPSAQARITHGSFFFIANEEGLVANNSVHAGIRCKMIGPADISNDESVGFKVISTDDLDDIGIPEVIRRIRKRIGDSPVYLSLDIDVVDPGLAPATGTPEAGGWTTREVKRIIRGLAGLNFVGADIVEVAPAYDHADITSIAAADLVHDFLSMMMSLEPPKSRDERSPWVDEL
ncbi:Arginase/deacetylase [Auriscalpium vulgare]|uniref:Arginase/deacetylase n=1 Tax=Auriscalpium vulgare TaxID=40419 RepID=A0ACB8SB72_9AGAM|nr:Arginase/deacetylase [Auriscalpium vulgare]